MSRSATLALFLSSVFFTPALLPAKIVVGSYPATTSPVPVNNDIGAIIGDYNSDGIPDAAGMGSDGAIQVLFGAPNGFFRKGPQTVSAGPGTIYGARDINRDGKLDLVAVLGSAPGPFQIAIFFGNGDGTFQTPVLTSVPNAGNGTVFVISPDAPDFNADGIPDLVLYNGGDLAVYLGSATGTFSLSTQLPNANCSNSVAADFDGDGHLDLALTCLYPTLLFGKGNGTFGTPVTIDSVEGSAVAVADLNHDGRPDLAFALELFGLPTPTLNVYLNIDGVHFSPTSYTVAAVDGGCCGVHQIGIADLNSDGHPDIFATGGMIQVLFGAGDGTFPGTPDTYQAGGMNVIATDMNRDGIPDLIDTSNPLIVLLGKGAGKFLVPPPLTITNSPGSHPGPLAKIDLDGDGLDDLIFFSNNASGITESLSTALNQGNGTFLASSLNVFTDAFRDFDAFACCIAVKDLNGDGRADIVYGSTTSAIQVSLATSTGAFPPGATVATLPASSELLAIETGDFNSDNLPDIAALYFQQNPSGQNYLALAILRGDGKGAFKISKTVALPNNSCGFSCSLKAGDFNGDGKADVAYLDIAGVHVLLGNGDGTFRPAFQGASFRSSGMVVRDLNGDGLTDIALLDNTTPNSTLSVLLSLGEGTFSVANYPLASVPFSITAADLNADGLPDLITGAGNEVTVLANNGDGTFAPAGSWAATMNYGSYPLAGAFLSPGHPAIVTGNFVLPVANRP